MISLDHLQIWLLQLLTLCGELCIFFNDRSSVHTPNFSFWQVSTQDGVPGGPRVSWLLVPLELVAPQQDQLYNWSPSPLYVSHHQLITSASSAQTTERCDATLKTKPLPLGIQNPVQGVFSGAPCFNNSFSFMWNIKRTWLGFLIWRTIFTDLSFSLGEYIYFYSNSDKLSSFLHILQSLNLSGYSIM